MSTGSKETVQTLDHQFFNKCLIGDALELIEDLYVQPGEGGQGVSNPRIVPTPLKQDGKRQHQKYDELRDEYWGVIRTIPGGAHFSIGTIGKIWAALLVLVLARNGNAPTQRYMSRRLADDMIRRFKDMGEQLSDKILYPDIDDSSGASIPFCTEEQMHQSHATALTDLLQSGKRIQKVPPPGLGSGYLKIAVYYVFSELENMSALTASTYKSAKLDADDVLAFLKETTFENLKECYLGIAARLGIKVPGNADAGGSTSSKALHEIDASVLKYVSQSPNKVRQTDLERLVEAIDSRLRVHKGPGAGKAIIVGLVGQAHAGKKAVIGDFVRSLVEKSKTTIAFTLTSKAGTPVAELPVCCVQLRQLHYNKLAELVLNFLQGLEGANSLDSQKVSEHPAPVGDLERLIERIVTLHRTNPALFIFMDIDGVAHESVRRILQRKGVRRLIARLKESNPRSRFVITTSQKWAVDNDPHHLGDVEWLTVPKPNIRRLPWYLDSDEATWFQDRLQSGLIKPKDQKVELRGDGLMALATISRGPQSRAEFSRWTEHYIQESEKSPENGLNWIFSKLVSEWAQAGLLEAVALISSSFDGTEDATLRHCLWKWQDETPETMTGSQKLPRNSEGGLDREDFEQWLAGLVEELKRLNISAKGLFLRHGGAAYYDTEEISYREDVTSESSPDRMVWEFEQRVAYSILLAIREVPAFFDVLRTAQRLIAIAARRRAQFKKIRSRSEDPYFATHGIGRDVQSYLALLASLNPDADYNDKDINLQSLHLSHQRVFTVSKDFSDAFAFQFAVRCMLRGDIDRDHRLTMVTDQDSLRLRLYLLPFLEIGDVRAWALRESEKDSEGEADILLDELPESVSSQIAESFRPGEQIDLLMTIALTAYHCQRPKVIAWALKLATPIFKRDKGLLSQYVRIVCAKIDISVALGRVIDENGEIQESSGFAELRQELESQYYNALFGEFSPNFEEIPAPDEIERIRAWMRLKARRAELCWITEPGDEASNQVYEEIESAEHRLAALNGQKPPVVMIGRTARRRIRHLTAEFPIFQNYDKDKYPWARDKKDTANLLLEANISRLVRFSGAERISVLMDLARRYLAAGEIDLAMKVFSDTRNWNYSSSMSRGGRVELQMLVAASEILTIEKLVQECGWGSKLREEAAFHMRNAEFLINSLTEVTVQLGYYPSSLIGELLAIRLNGLIEATGCDVSMVVAESNLAGVAKKFQDIGFNKAATLCGQLRVFSLADVS